MRRSLPERRLLARVRPVLRAPLPLLGLVAAAGPLALSAGSEAAVDVHPAEAAYHALPALPTGSSDAGREGVEATAIALAASLGAVPIDALGGECPDGELAVRWSRPAEDEFTAGAFVSPIGPAPAEVTTEVNGIVVCGSHDHAFMGFEARFADGRWDVVEVPYVGEGDDEHLVAQPAPAIPAGPKPVPVLAAPGTVSGPIEGYAAYEPQRTCDPTAKAGTRSLAGALLRDYAGSRNLGIVRGCSVGGRSEHKEGRAFDWGVNVSNPDEKVAAESFINALMATDAAGNRHALARRMGVMYVIFDRQIWSSYRAAEGWRPYTGASPHRDHVHLSMSWAGATARTSFWSGTVPPDLPTASPGTSTVASSRRSTTGGGGTHDVPSGARRAWRRDGRDGGAGEDRSRGVRLRPDELAAGVDALWSGDQPPSAGAIEAWLVNEGVPQEPAQQYAARAADRAQRQATRNARRSSDGDADETEDGDTGDESRRRRDERDAEREARDERRREERADRQAEEQRRREERERQRADERARREAEQQRRREERAARAAEEEAERASRSADADGDGRRGRGGRRGGWGATTTTAPTTTTEAPTTTTAAPEATTTTAAPDATTTTTG